MAPWCRFHAMKTLFDVTALLFHLSPVNSLSQQSSYRWFDAIMLMWCDCILRHFSCHLVNLMLRLVEVCEPQEGAVRLTEVAWEGGCRRSRNLPLVDTSLMAASTQLGCFNIIISFYQYGSCHWLKNSGLHFHIGSQIKHNWSGLPPYRSPSLDGVWHGG